MKRWLILLYGLTAYGMFLGVFLYAVLFLGNFLLPRTLDSSPVSSIWFALGVNLALLTGFAFQHSGMARPAFKKWLTQWIPEPVERSTYVLMSNIAMILLFAFWQPMGGTIWHIDESVARSAIIGLYFTGWAIVFLSTCAICHFDLFGVRQVWTYFRGQTYQHRPFKIPLPYRVVRHPLYVGWLLVIWASPMMTLAHLIFALVTTTYILVAIQLEERDLVNFFGKKYETYRSKVPMLIPIPRFRKTMNEPMVDPATDGNV